MKIHLFLPTWFVFHIFVLILIYSLNLSSLSLCHKIRNKKQTECLSDIRLMNVLKWQEKCISLLSADKRALIIFFHIFKCKVITTNTCVLLLLTLKSPAPSTLQHTLYTKLSWMNLLSFNKLAKFYQLRRTEIWMKVAEKSNN